MSLIAFLATLLIRNPHLLQRKFAGVFVLAIFAFSELSKISSFEFLVLSALLIHWRPTARRSIVSGLKVIHGCARRGAMVSGAGVFHCCVLSPYFRGV